MPLTIKLADHNAEHYRYHGVQNRKELLKNACKREYRLAKEIIQSSFTPGELEKSNITGWDNGLVRSAVSAYSDHHNLVIRPEDVWFAIMSQFGFYVNAHAEELRSHFVEHEGKKELKIEVEGTRYNVPFQVVTDKFAQAIKDNVKDPMLAEWIMPSFSTTTDCDKVVGAALMMGAMQAYFEYTACYTCGLPSITLLGERSDWEDIERRIEKLTEFGDEPAQFRRLLRPVLRHILMTFDKPQSEEVKDFWSRIADRSNESGVNYISGWIAAFCFWTDEGKILANGKPDDKTLEHFQLSGCHLDGVDYHIVSLNEVPAGVTAVPITLDDNGTIIKSRLCAGSVGIKAYKNEDPALAERGSSKRGRRGDGDADKPVLNTIQPVSGWWLYEAQTQEDAARQEEEKERRVAEKLQQYIDSDDPNKVLNLEDSD